MTQPVNAMQELPAEDRLAVFGIDADVMATVRAFRPTLVADLPELFELLSRRVAQSPALQAAMGDQAVAIREIESAHLLNLFDARFDSAYLRARKRPPAANTRSATAPARA